MDDFWGGREWRDLPIVRCAVGSKVDPAELGASLDHSWVGAFREKMTAVGFKYQDHSAPTFCNEKNVVMYHLLFFSHHPLALNIWRSIKRIDARGQRRMRYDEK